MRYDTPVFFQRVLPGEYDSKTGNYAADQVTEVQKMASVMDTRAEIMQIVYGESIENFSTTLGEVKDGIVAVSGFLEKHSDAIAKVAVALPNS